MYKLDSDTLVYLNDMDCGDLIDTYVEVYYDVFKKLPPYRPMDREEALELLIGLYEIS